MGSGSACRSIPGGFVEWEAGHSHETSIAREVFPAKHWPGLDVFAFVINNEKKLISSTKGMAALDPVCIEERIKAVPPRLEAIKAAVAARNFATLGQITMTDSDHFHNVAERSGATYLKPASHAFKQVIADFNKSGIKVAYTYDAGPNPFVIVQQENAKDFLEYLMDRFSFTDYSQLDARSQELITKDRFNQLKRSRDQSVLNVFRTRVGAEGARVVEASELGAK
mmetsp:Transcript_23915/g.42357  ORF Transcript_23915/g.42357 Transcript_23915/m.42357 type:complete len:225 (+) Transcript_23915:2677-3351(+)